MLSRSFEKHPDLRTALENPVLSVQEKFSLICAATVGDAPAERELARFIMLVLKTGVSRFAIYMLELFGFIQKRQAHWYCQTDNSRTRKPRGLGTYSE